MQSLPVPARLVALPRGPCGIPPLGAAGVPGFGGAAETQQIIRFRLNGAGEGDDALMYGYTWDEPRIQTAVIGAAQRGARIDVAVNLKEIYGVTSACLAVSKVLEMMRIAVRCEAGVWQPG